jgi:hypothetical protein
VADSSPEPDRPYRHTRPLSHLARRCLHERRALSVSSMTAPPAEADQPRDRLPDWELDWPALVYAPVGMPGDRPIGLLTVGSRRQHWYEQDEVDYVAAVAVAMTGLLLGLNGPLGRLNRRQLEGARLLAQGMSIAEVAAALELCEPDARRLVGEVLRKLALRSPSQLTQAWPGLGPA